MYDYVLAYDDTRVARDVYFFSLRRDALRGGAEFVFADELDVESLEFRIARIVEQWVKEKEI
ncbi:hypothetical protein ACFQE1_00415 [Halobium palmae]|uniref:Uncharacterized protein n=1 Tax=Halobium palmae TaxID=1776492 RepID=A0ABD5RU04_9EURY